MIKWFLYIVLLLICTPCLLSASANRKNREGLSIYVIKAVNRSGMLPADTNLVRSVKQTKQQETDDKKKIKEVAKAKKQSKPEKVDDPAEGASKTKPKRQRRPAGMERPPEIPRRNGN